MKSERQASLSSVLLAARKASMVPEETSEGAPAPNLRVVETPPEAPEETVPPPLPPPADELRPDLMFSKGAASAAGFRPAHWTYERSANGDTPLDAAAEPPAAAYGASNTDVSPPADPRPAARRRTQWAVIGFGAVALVVSTAPLLNMGSAPVVKSTVPSVTVTQAPPPPAARSAAAAGPPSAAVLPLPAANTPPSATPVPAATATVEKLTAAVPSLPIAPIPPEVKTQTAVAIVPPPPAAPSTSAADAEDMLLRGISALETGDVAAARLYLERAADVSDAHAALLLGQSFDPAFLKRIGALGVRGDPAQAATWYRKARALGEPTAQAHLDSLATK